MRPDKMARRATRGPRASAFPPLVPKCFGSTRGCTADVTCWASFRTQDGWLEDTPPPRQPPRMEKKHLDNIQTDYESTL